MLSLNGQQKVLLRELQYGDDLFLMSRTIKRFRNKLRNLKVLTVRF